MAHLYSVRDGCFICELVGKREIMWCAKIPIQPKINIEHTRCVWESFCQFAGLLLRRAAFWGLICFCFGFSFASWNECLYRRILNGVHVLIMLSLSVCLSVDNSICQFCALHQQQCNTRNTRYSLINLRSLSFTVAEHMTILSNPKIVCFE